jgi:hypothetical protein
MLRREASPGRPSRRSTGAEDATRTEANRGKAMTDYVHISAVGGAR